MAVILADDKWDPPSWQDIPIFPGTQPAVQLPVAPSQESKQLQWVSQRHPQRSLGQSARWMATLSIWYTQENMVVNYSPQYHGNLRKSCSEMWYNLFVRTTFRSFIICFRHLHISQKQLQAAWSVFSLFTTTLAFTHQTPMDARAVLSQRMLLIARDPM